MSKQFLILGLIVALAAGAATADTWTVKLANGDVHDGVLVRLEAGRYLLQTDGQLIELSDDDIDASTFTERDRADAEPRHPLHEVRHYDEIHADGNVTMHWEMHIPNRSHRAITELRFGLAPWERAHADQRRYRDPFGNVLAPEYDPARDRWSKKPDQRVQVTIDLPVPVAPGEAMVINADETTPRIKAVDGAYRYLSVGDFAEDRLIWRKVRLPHGAKITGITPEATVRFTDDGYEYVMWRRLYKAGERIPLEIIYTLD